MLMNKKKIKTTLRFTTFNARNEMPVFCLHISSSLHSIRIFRAAQIERTEYVTSLNLI